MLVKSWPRRVAEWRCFPVPGWGELETRLLVLYVLL